MIEEYSFREVQVSDMGAITANLDFDFLKVRGRVPLSTVNAFFKHSGRCLIACMDTGVSLYFKRKFLYLPWGKK